jgi:hypothetical protein
MYSMKTTISVSCFLLLCISFIRQNSRAYVWYGYTENKVFDESCGANTTTIPDRLTIEQVQKYKLWQGISSGDDIVHGESMSGFLEGMDAIWKNQHPKDCSKAKFLVSLGWEEGFGSETHVVGAGLGIALAMNRVFVLLKDDSKQANDWQVKTEYCRAQGDTKTLNCYYEPWTHCTEEQILGNMTTRQLYANNEILLETDTPEPGDYTPELKAEHRILLGKVSSMTKRFVPTDALKRLVHCHTLLHNDHDYYWWRVLSTAYQLRPNKGTTALLEQHRKDPTVNFDPATQTCVSMYVRRGDKHQEMAPVPLEMYFEAAKTAWTNILKEAKENGGAEPSGPPVLFIGSEDQAVIDQAVEWGAGNNWGIRYTSLFNRQNQMASMNYTMQQRMKSNHKQFRYMHHPMEYFSMILNLDSFIKCKAFVCTQNSNFCRVIDELRASVGGKANRELIDMEVFSGRHQPNTKTLGW